MTVFEDEERNQVKNMILALGATYTSYLTEANSAIVCKR